MGDTETLESATYTVTKYQGHEVPRQYLNYIYCKWSRTYRNGNDYIKLAERGMYFSAYRNHITHILLKTLSTVRIASLTDDIDVALGFSVVRSNVLDYIYVQKDFRKEGIGRQLLPKNIEVFTHLTRMGMKLWSTQLPKAKFNPFA